MNRRSSPVCAAEIRTPSSEDGFLLLGAIVAIALVLLALSIAAPKVARELRRERDEETVHRGNQYVRAIQLYYRRFGHYPGSVDQLVNTNNIRFLRQRYSDPATGKDEFRVIPVGQNKTTVKTFFGQPIGGIASTGVGSVANMLSTGMGGAGATGTSGATGAASQSTPSSGLGLVTPSSGLGGSPGVASTQTATGATGATSTNSAGGTTDASVFSGGAQPFIGVGLNTKGDSIVEPNGQTTYETWEFLYDPRLDQLRARAAALNGAGVGSVPSSSLGQSGGSFGATGSTGATGATGAGTPGAANPAPATPPAAAGAAGTQP